MPYSPPPRPRHWPLLAALAAAMAALWILAVMAVQAPTCDRDGVSADWLPCLAQEEGGLRSG